MKKIFLIFMIAALVLFAGCSSTSNNTTTTTPSQAKVDNPSDAPKNWKVKIESFQFSPDSLTINKGDTVTWQNMDNVPHTISSDQGTEINSDTLDREGTYSHTFDKSGTYNYHCSVHPSMAAKIVVN